MTDGAPDGLVRCHGVTKRYELADRTLVALDGVTFEVGAGSATSVVGRNGAGKSTLLRVVAGITAPSAGRVERSARLASVIELSAGFEPDLTGRENLRIALALAGVTGRERHAATDRALALAGVGRACDDPVKHYSTGMLARLSLGAAVASRPSVLLVDEVLAVGDLVFQRAALEAIEELRRDGTAVLLVTHSLQLARVATDRALWLEQGRVLADGPVDSVTNDYERSFGVDRRRSAEDHTRLVGVRLADDPVEPGAELGVQVIVERHAPPSPLALRVELRPPVLHDGESDWLRPVEESAPIRDMNLIARGEDLMLGELGPGRYVIDATFPRLPLTACRVDVGVAVADLSADEILDEASVPLTVGEGGSQPPKLLLELRHRQG